MSGAEEWRLRAARALAEVVAGAPEGPTRAALGLMALAARLRLGVDGAEAELAALGVKEKVAVLELVSANQPARGGLGAVALEVAFQTQPYAVLSDRHLVLWAKLAGVETVEAAREAVAAARLEETNSQDRLRIFGRLIAAGVPETEAGLEALVGALAHEVEVDAVVTAWCLRHPWGARTEALLGRVGSPGARLEAIVGMMLLGEVPQAGLVAGLGAAEAALMVVTQHRELTLARKAALQARTGAEWKASWAEALALTERESDPAMMARAHRVLAQCAALIGFQAWQEVVEHAVKSRVYLRDVESWLVVRAELVRTVPAACREASEVDRAHQLLKELGRRLPNRWFDLLHYAVVAERVAAMGGRAPEVQLGEIEGWLTKEGLPRPVVAVAVEEVTRPLMEVAPGRMVALIERLPSPPQKAVWAAALAAP